MSKIFGALALVLCLSLFGSSAAMAFADASPSAVAQDGKGKKKNGRKHGKKKDGKKKHHGKKHKGKQGKKKDKK